MSNKLKAIGRRLKSAGYCDEHENFNELRCMDCESWICGVCVALKHKPCRTLLVEEALKELKVSVKQKVMVEMGRSSEISTIINEHLQDLSEKHRSLTSELKCNEDQLRELTSLNLNGSKLCEQLKKIQTLVDDSLNFNDFLNAKVDLPILLEDVSAVSEDLQFYVTLTTWCQNGDVYAVEVQDNNNMYGKISVKKSQVWVSSFQSIKPEARLIPLKELLDNLCVSPEFPYRTFLQLVAKEGSGEEEEVEVVIETDRFNPRSVCFQYICSGLKGYTCKGKDFEHNCLPDDSLGYRLMEYEKKPFVEGILDDEAVILMKKGDVFGMGEDCLYFGICLKDDDIYPQHKFGIVTSGFQKLKNRLDQPGGCYIIKECGLVF